MKYKTELRAKAQLTKISKSDISQPFDIIKPIDEAQLFTPSQDMIDLSKQGLNLANDNFKGVSKLKISVAKNIANGKNLSISAVKRINKYFEKYDSETFEVDEELNTIAWNLYGGTPGKAWSAAIIAIENKKTTATHDLDPDLLKMKSILVSQGMNLNDDVFLKEELVLAKCTGADKPVNIEHSDTEIIGHMLSTFVVSKDGEILEDMEDIELEDEIDIVNEAVIYAYIFPEIAARIQELASRNELFVSVEAWFADYDYLLGGNIIKRTEATEHILEKHIRINGGDGFYNGEKLGRVLRNIMFGGIGIVATPANPESLILEVGDMENSMASEDAVIASHIVGKLEGINDLKAEKEKEMAKDVRKIDVEISDAEAILDSQEQLEETQKSDELVSVVDASEINSTDEEDSNDSDAEDLTIKADVVIVDESEVVEAASPQDVENETSDSDEKEVSLEVSVEQVDTDASTQSTDALQHPDDQDEETMHGTHDHPDLMVRLDHLEQVSGMLGSLLSKAGDLIVALEEKVILLESEALIGKRHKDLQNAGLTDEMIAARLNKVSLMNKDDFDAYLHEVKDILKASQELSETVEDVVIKEIEASVTEEVEVLEISLNDIEPVDTELNVEVSNPVSTDKKAQFLSVISEMFSKADKHR